MINSMFVHDTDFCSVLYTQIVVLLLLFLLTTPGHDDLCISSSFSSCNWPFFNDLLLLIDTDY